MLSKLRNSLVREKNQLRIKREKFEKEKLNFQKKKKLIPHLEQRIDDLEKQIKHRKNAIRALDRLSRLDELEKMFAWESIYGQTHKEFQCLLEITSKIGDKKRLAQENQQKYANIERSKIHIFEKKQEQVKLSQEREETLKQLRTVVNQMNLPGAKKQPQLEERHKQLTQELRNFRINSKKLSSELDNAVKSYELLSRNKDMLPEYIHIQKEIEMLKAEKNELEAAIGQRVFELMLKEQIEFPNIENKENQ